MQIFGVDLSLNHAGVVKIDQDQAECTGVCYITNKKMEMLVPDGELYSFVDGPDYQNHFLMPWNNNKMEELGKEVYSAYRRRLVSEHVFNYIWDSVDADVEEDHYPYVNIEQYAYGKKTQGQHDIAELGGIVKGRLIALSKVRQTDPLTVKMWAGTGSASKRNVYEYTQNPNWLSPLPMPNPNKLLRDGKEDLEGVGTDVCDAFVLAEMLWVELELRRGNLQMDDLNKQQIKVFNRVTKSYPVNLLNRPFISMHGVMELEEL